MADGAALRDAVRAWVARAEEDPRVKACWLEGTDPRALRAGAGPVDLHVGVEDPDFDLFVPEVAAFIGAAAPVRQHADGPAQPDAWATVAEVDGLGSVSCTLERMSLVAKRPRAAVQPLFDRTEQLRHVLDYSAARRPAAPAHGRTRGGSPVSRHPELLERSAVSAALGHLADWHHQGGEILASFQMPTFLSGMGLVGEVALAAEQANHHPNILIQYRTVSFSLSTHEAGGITQRDLDLAGVISEIATAIKAGKKRAAKGKRKKKAGAKKAAKKKAAKKKKKKAPAKRKTKATKKAKKKKAARKKGKKKARR